MSDDDRKRMGCIIGHIWGYGLCALAFLIPRWFGWW